MRNDPPRWDAVRFFERLTETNKLARQHGFRFCRISGLTGMEEALATMQQTPAFVMVSDAPVGTMDTDNTPHQRRTVMVILAMRHRLDDMQARAECLLTMQELFRQFMSALIPERTRMQENALFIEPRVALQVFNKYLTPGVTCYEFEVATTAYVDLTYQEDEWYESEND